MQTKRYLLHSANILCDIFTGLTISPSSPSHQYTILVSKAYRQTIKFKLSNILDSRITIFKPKLPPYSRIKRECSYSRNVGFRPNRKHGNRVTHRLSCYKKRI